MARTLVSLVVVETLVFWLAVLPAWMFWNWILSVAAVRCQIGALRAVPKYAHLEAGSLYGGVPVSKITKPTPSPVEVG